MNTGRKAMQREQDGTDDARPLDPELLSERYDRDARAYRDLWAPILRGAVLRLLRRISPGDVLRIVDIGSGVGSMLPHLQTTFPDALVLGVDRSRGMLALSPAGIPRAVMDATCLGVASAGVDLVLMAFVLFHLERPLDGLREALRVLRRGGRMATATWGQEIESPASRIWTECLDAHGAPEADPSAAARHDPVNTPEKMEALLRAAGFSSAHCWLEELASSIELDRLIRLKTAMGSARSRFDSLPPSQREACVSAARCRMEKLPPEAFVAGGTVVYALASA